MAGAIFGAGSVIATEIGGVAHGGSGGVLALLWSSSESRTGQVNAVQTAALLLIEFGASVLVFALLFALPVAVFVGIRRIFTGRSGSGEQPETAQADDANHR